MNMSNTIHWLGAGLSSTPGIRRLAQGNTAFIVWNLDRAQTRDSLLAAGVDTDVRELVFPDFWESIERGDIVVSMLPATMHLDVARESLQHGAHFVSSSYISPEMRAMHDDVIAAGLCFVNEMGLDPGIDHLFSHLLVDRFRQSGRYRPGDRVSFRSYCGGLPKHVNDFRYKFSWSPLGTLLALTSPARWIEGGLERETAKPWQALRQVSVAARDETFEAYPNRDSLPFVAQYGFDPAWQLDEFIRGTLRLDGWAEAWQPVFAEIDAVDRTRAATALEPLAAELGRNYSYAPGEPDRVVLSVELEARRDGETTWFGSFLIDACGDQRGQAMARLVSLPVSLAVDSILAGEFAPGVHAATTRPDVIENWLAALEELGEEIVGR
jgi:saccharopine dehydrogenase (NADP+, L-glutamate forming)